MQITGMLYGAKLLQFVGFPTSEVLGPAASEEEIKALIERHGSVFVKPVFKGGVGKKGKAGLLGRAKDLKTALKEKERLYFAEHRHGNQFAKANGVTFEGAVPAEHEVYFSITDSTHFRAPTMTLTHYGGMDIEELDKSKVAQIPFDALTGMKAFVVANALSALNAPKELISPLVQQLPKLWELYHDFGMTTLELNPIRMRPERGGRLTPVACDFKCGFDRDDPRWQRLNLPPHVFAMDFSDFEQEINQLRTYQGQSDVYVINAKGTILAPTFGGGANSLVTELLGDDAIISSDFGGNPPYEKMKEVARICFKHWLRQTNVLFIIGGKSNNTDIFETFRAMADALREHFSVHGATPLYVVIGRGGPNLVRGMGAMRDTFDALGLPYRIFGFDSDMSEVIGYAQAVDAWMKAGGRELVAAKLNISGPTARAAAADVAAVA
jgi:succinyl-CoA synthetase beta subunit